MSIRFTALTVRDGDAFLLEDDGWNCLFDSGVNKSIVDLLTYKGIEKLDLAICSHNDDDHAGGFIELLDSPIKIDEIWLPGLWANVLLFVKENCKKQGEVELDDEDFNAEFDSVFSDESVSEESFNQGLSFFVNLEDTKQFDKIKNRMHDELSKKLAYKLYEDTSFLSRRLGENKDIDENVIRENHDSWPDFFLNVLFSSVYKRHERARLEFNNSLDIKLDNIMRIASLAKQKCCDIRWFEPSTACTIEPIDYGFVSLNSSKMCRIREPKSGMAYIYLLHLSTVNKYSLVFDYTKNGVPIIRFSADSDSTCQSENPYPKSIIVTAPHHGSKANAKVYHAINGNDLIWVRSDCMTSIRPCDEFKAQKSKYCLACYQSDFVSEICFEYNPVTEKWDYVHGEPCRC